MGRGGPDRLGERHALDLGIAGSEQGVGAVLDPRRDVGVGRAAVGRVVLEAAVGGRIVRRRDHDAVARVLGAAAVVDEDRVRDDRRRRHAVVALDDRLDAVGGQHLERRPLGRTGEGVRVLAQEQRAVDPLRPAVLADRLGDRQDVGLGEGAVERRAAMPAGAEGDALARVGRIGPIGIVRLLERRHVDQDARGGQLPARGWIAIRPPSRQ